jgi:hypothetical protein
MPFNSGMLLIDGHRFPQADPYGHPPGLLEASPVQTVPVAVHSHRVSLPAAPPLPLSKESSPKVHDGRGSFGAIKATRVSEPRLLRAGKIHGGVESWNRVSGVAALAEMLGRAA